MVEILCPYCHKPLIGRVKDGRIFCTTCHFWMREDGQPDREQREWLKKEE